MTNTYAAAAAFVAIVASFIIAGMVIFAPPIAAAETPNRMDIAAFAYWERQMAEATDIDAVRVIDAQAPRGGDRPHILPPPAEWDGDIRVCDADHNAPDGWTRFGGFCQQIAYPDRQSLLFQGTDAIFGFKGK